MLEKRLISVLAETIHLAEKRRVAAAKEDFNDQLFKEDLEFVRQAIETFETRERVPIDDYEKSSPKLLAGICHLYIMAATIQQTRAKHTLTAKENKMEALDEASQHLEKALPIGERLAERGYLKAIDETFFIWPAELHRGLARIKMRHPESEVDEIKEARDLFRTAKIEGYEVYINKKNERKLRGAGLLTTATARVEELMAEKRLVEIQGKTWRKEDYHCQLEQTRDEINEAEELDYHNPNRRDETLRRIAEEL